MHYRIIALSFILLSQAACGGGGGSTGSTSTTSSQNATSPQTASINGIYAQSSISSTADADLAQLNKQGALGYAWVSPLVSYDAGHEYYNLYVKSSLRLGSVFNYKADAEPAAFADLLTLLNQRGSEGYAYKGPYIYGSTYSMFVKDSTKSTTFAYEMLSISASANIGQLLAQLNSQGARGFQMAVTLASASDPTSMVNLYSKSSTGPTNYTYTSRSLGAAFAPANKADLISQLQQGSADGSQFVSPQVVGGRGYLLFVRPSDSTAAVQYEVEDIPAGETAPAMLTAINAKAAAGTYLLSDFYTADMGLYRIYVKGKVLPIPLAGLVFP